MSALVIVIVNGPGVAQACFLDLLSFNFGFFILFGLGTCHPGTFIFYAKYNEFHVACVYVSFTVLGFSLIMVLRAWCVGPYGTIAGDGCGE